MKSLFTFFATLLLVTICLTENAVAQQAGLSSLGALAYIRGGDLWMQELPDGEARHLTTDADDSSPLWSPSGQWITFHKGDQLRLIRKSGADARVLNHGAPATHVAWSPLSDMIAYTTRTGDLVIASAGDGSERTLVSSPTPREGSGMQSFAWSADGKWIAYALQKDLKPPQSDQPPDLYAGLWRIRADGSGPVEIFGGPIALGSPRRRLEQIRTEAPSSRIGRATARIFSFGRILFPNHSWRTAPRSISLPLASVSQRSWPNSRSLIPISYPYRQMAGCSR